MLAGSVRYRGSEFKLDRAPPAKVKAAQNDVELLMSGHARAAICRARPGCMMIRCGRGGFVINTTLRSSWVVLAIAIVLQAPRLAHADSQSPPPGPPPPYQAPPPGSGPPPNGPPPSGPPPNAPPGYGPPGYGPQPYPAPIEAPEEITDFDDTQPVPRGYTKVSRARKGLIIGGACTFGGVYLFTTLVAAIADDINKADGSTADVTPLYIPVVGPFVELAQTNSSVAKFYLALSGLGQTAGAVMLIYGLTNPRSILVRNDQLTIAPMFGNGASGLSVLGRF